MRPHHPLYFTSFYLLTHYARIRRLWRVATAARVLDCITSHVYGIVRGQFCRGAWSPLDETIQITLPLMSSGWQRLKNGFRRRYKWIMNADYDDIETPVIAAPELDRFMKACVEVLDASIPLHPPAHMELNLCLSERHFLSL